MNIWMHQVLSLLLAGKIPQVPAGSVQPNGGPQTAPQGPGVPGGSPESSASDVKPVVEPQAVVAKPGQISPVEFYQLDPNDPNSRMTGAQLGEVYKRNQHYNALQSSLHRTTNERDQAVQQAQALQEQLDKVQEQERFAQYVTQGQKPSIVPQPAAVQGQQPQVQPQEPAGVDDWLLEFGTPPNAPPNTPPNTPQAPEAQNTTAYDPNQLIGTFNMMMQENNKKLMDQLQEHNASLVQEEVGRRMSETARQNSLRTNISTARQQLSEGMQNKFGISEERSRDIMDKMYLSMGNTEEASRLMQANYNDPVEAQNAQNLANQKLAQANQLFASALTDAVQEATSGVQQRQAQEARQMLETGSYITPEFMGELASPKQETYDPVEINKRNQMNLQKAMEIGDMQQRLQVAAGGASAGPSQLFPG